MNEHVRDCTTYTTSLLSTLLTPMYCFPLLPEMISMPAIRCWWGEERIFVKGFRGRQSVMSDRKTLTHLNHSVIDFLTDCSMLLALPALKRKEK